MQTADDYFAPTRMATVSHEWCSSQSTEEHLSLANCFRFVKFKMNAQRDMRVIADVAQRREFCVALYEYTHRVVSLCDADDAFVEQYNNARARQPRPRPAADAVAAPGRRASRTELWN